MNIEKIFNFKRPKKNTKIPTYYIALNVMKINYNFKGST